MGLFNRLVEKVIRSRPPSLVQSEYSEYSSTAIPVYSPWQFDPDFLDISAASKEEAGKDIRHIQYTLARHAVHLLQGDWIEFGVFQGRALDIFAGILDRFDTRKRKLFGIDSFQGLAVPSDKDGQVVGGQFFAAGGLKAEKADVERNLSGKHNCPILLKEGWIPDVFSQIDSEEFSFAHVDVDLYDATRDTLEFIYSKMVPGGIILFDDYGFPMCLGARRAVDEFLKGCPEILINLPTGQAFLIKQ